MENLRHPATRSPCTSTETPPTVVSYALALCDQLFAGPGEQLPLIAVSNKEVNDSE